MSRLLIHNVYFALHDNSESARAKLVQACQKYLPGHAGIVFFACGTRAEELRREVNVVDFDVALHVIFRDQSAHDAYQVSQPHNAFVAENKVNWKSVRVFDSLAEQTPTS
jgi:Stress responsive A/B Barrel Domain